MIKSKSIFLTVCLSLMSGMTFAAGFGVSGQSAKDKAAITNAEVAKLLGQASEKTKATSSSQQQSNTPSHATQQTNSMDTVSNQAFAQTARNMVPMTPDQIKTLRYMIDQSQRAAATSPGVPTRPTSSSVLVSLSPGATPPIIRLRAGFVSSLDFLDATGAPWPIAAFDLGDPKSFNIQWDRKGNTLLLQANSEYKSGNLAVMLKGQSTPVMLTLMPGQSNVDYRVDLRVPGMGPNAKVSMSGLPAVSNPQLINFLDGVPPSGAKAYVVGGDGGQSQAWMYQNKLYLRTRSTVLSPGWVSSMSSPDGTHVYALPKTPVVLASLQGAMVHLNIKGL